MTDSAQPVMEMNWNDYRLQMEYTLYGWTAAQWITACKIIMRDGRRTGATTYSHLLPPPTNAGALELKRWWWDRAFATPAEVVAVNSSDTAILSWVMTLFDHEVARLEAAGLSHDSLRRPVPPWPKAHTTHEVP